MKVNGDARLVSLEGGGQNVELNRFMIEFGLEAWLTRLNILLT
jgi:hypothetical protein